MRKNLKIILVPRRSDNDWLNQASRAEAEATRRPWEVPDEGRRATGRLMIDHISLSVLEAVSAPRFEPYSRAPLAVASSRAREIASLQ